MLFLLKLLLFLPSLLCAPVPRTYTYYDWDPVYLDDEINYMEPLFQDEEIDEGKLTDEELAEAALPFHIKEKEWSDFEEWGLKQMPNFTISAAPPPPAEAVTTDMLLSLISKLWTSEKNESLYTQPPINVTASSSFGVSENESEWERCDDWQMWDDKKNKSEFVQPPIDVVLSPVSQSPSAEPSPFLWQDWQLEEDEKNNSQPSQSLIDFALSFAEPMLSTEPSSSSSASPSPWEDWQLWTYDKNESQSILPPVNVTASSFGTSVNQSEWERWDDWQMWEDEKNKSEFIQSSQAEVSKRKCVISKLVF